MQVEADASRSAVPDLDTVDRLRYSRHFRPESPGVSK